jgi:serine/threonine protein kinase/Tol biopolymer transport system component
MPGSLPTNLTDLTGQNIAHYFLENRLGGGAMASVYRARDQILDRVIALKVLMPGADPLTRARFRQEARTVSTLDHPHVVRTLQVGQTSADGIAYIAMELVEGQSLSTLLERYNTLNVMDVCNLLEPIARALAYAHGLGIVHRDVKPSNILLRWASTNAPNSIQLSALDSPVIPLLSDFGIARALDAPELTSAGRTIGTPSYMAPEQCAGSRELDGRADIYSLGTVLYRCLVGRPPFVGTTTQILHAHVYEPLTIPEKILKDLPPVVVEILQRTLMKDVERRYMSASMFADHLAIAAGRQTFGAFVQNNPSANVPTRTMPVLPTANSLEDDITPSRVLVPGAGSTPTPVKSITPPSLPRVAAAAAQAKTPRPSSTQTVSAQRRRRRTNWLSLLVGAVLLLMLVLVGIAMVRSILPESTAYVPPEGPNAAVTAAVPSPTPFGVVGAADAITSTPSVSAEAEANANAGEASAVAPATAGETTEGSTDPSGRETAPSANSQRTPRPDSDFFEDPNSSVTPPALSVQSAWDDAQYFFARRDWGEAVTYLTLIRRSDTEFEREQVDEMLFTSYVGMATQAVEEAFTTAEERAEALASAAEFFEKALEVQDERHVSALLDATVAYRDAEDSRRAAARSALRNAQVEYASELASAENFCGAAEQATAALAVLYDGPLADQQAEYVQQCPQLEEALVVAEQTPVLEGDILYSSNRNGTDVIWTVPVTTSATSQILIENGSLPARQRNGTMIAFHGENSFGAEGIFGFDLAENLTPDQRSIQYTYHGEDSEQSPPSWNPTGTQLIYASTVSADRVFRVYYTVANGKGDYTWSADGREPSWHPTDNLVVYKGADDTGQRPGLWLMTGAGDNRRSLTSEPSDGRPVWSPDGRYVVFMSNNRHGNWEIYRLDMQNQEIIRLTSDPAFDGLPTVSPDGRSVAFVSDRGGARRFWITPIDGGDPQLLTSVAGDISNWTEHSIQWVK